MEDKKVIKGFKGFSKDLKCRGFQYELGKEYEHKGEVKACNSGFHFCEHPLNVFDYYAPSESRFAEVEGSGEISTDGSDTKVSSSKIKIGLELNFRSLVDAAIKFVFEKADWSKKETQATGDRGAASATGNQGAASATGNQGAASATGYQGAASATGNQGAASATGNRGAASATGYQGAASATGNRGAASATGNQGIAMAVGIEGKAKAKKGLWIVLSEWKQDENYNWERISVKSFKVDGKKVKEDVYYTLKKGKLVIAE